MRYDELTDAQRDELDRAAEVMWTQLGCRTTGEDIWRSVGQPHATEDVAPLGRFGIMRHQPWWRRGWAFVRRYHGF